MANIRIISTDFDGTLHEDFAHQPVPVRLQERLGQLQSRGCIWIINTGRDLASLMETMGRAALSVRPDYIVAVEREIFRHDGHRYVPVEPWNQRCLHDHARVFGELASEIGELLRELAGQYDADFYNDPWSPFCVIARNNAQMDTIQERLEAFCSTQSELAMVRNDVYLRLCHPGYSKGTALGEISRLAELTPDSVLAVGDHFNDLPMLDRRFAHWLGAPANAIDVVKQTVQRQGGIVAAKLCGEGVLEVLDRLEVTGS